MANNELRENCPMRHKNGNCMPAGGFCTAVNDAICEALHNAYDTGRRAADLAGRCYEIAPEEPEQPNALWPKENPHINKDYSSGPFADMYKKFIDVK